MLGLSGIKAQEKGDELMGVCHECRCFYCENLLSKKCPVPRVCSTCYKGLNSRNYKIIHCDNYLPVAPQAAIPEEKKKPKKQKKKRAINIHHKKRGG